MTSETTAIKEQYILGMMRFKEDPDFWEQHYNRLTLKQDQLSKKLGILRGLSKMLPDLIEQTKNPESLKLLKRYEAIQKVISRGNNFYQHNLP